MAYKNLYIITLLAPFALTSNINIEQLKNDISKKESELATIIEAINEKENIIDSMVLKMNNIIPCVVELLDSEDRNELGLEMNSYETYLQKALINQESIGPFFKEDFINRNKKSEFELKRVKYVLIRYTFEYVNLKKIIEQYEKCFQELLNLKHQLHTLQKLK